jgi:hypothetical protein
MAQTGTRPAISCRDPAPMRLATPQPHGIQPPLAQQATTLHSYLG